MAFHQTFYTEKHNYVSRTFLYLHVCLCITGIDYFRSLSRSILIFFPISSYVFHHFDSSPKFLHLRFLFSIPRLYSFVLNIHFLSFYIRTYVFIIYPNDFLFSFSFLYISLLFTFISSFVTHNVSVIFSLFFFPSNLQVGIQTLGKYRN